jgi:hypothetical protein
MGSDFIVAVVVLDSIVVAVLAALFTPPPPPPPPTPPKDNASRPLENATVTTPRSYLSYLELIGIVGPLTTQRR